MKDDEKKNSFGPLIRQMNEFFNQAPMRKFMHTFDEFFDKPLFESTIPIDMYETETELIIKADLPGIKREQISIEYLDTAITISVKHTEKYEEKNEKKHYYVKKHSLNQASRTVTLPYPILNKNVKATYRDGVLKISIPKQKRNKITIDE